MALRALKLPIRSSPRSSNRAAVYQLQSAVSRANRRSASRRLRRKGEFTLHHSLLIYSGGFSTPTYPPGDPYLLIKSPSLSTASLEVFDIRRDVSRFQAPPHAAHLRPSPRVGFQPARLKNNRCQPAISLQFGGCGLRLSKPRHIESNTLSRPAATRSHLPRAIPHVISLLRSRQ